MGEEGKHFFLDPMLRRQGGLKEDMDQLYAQREAVDLQRRTQSPAGHQAQGRREPLPAGKHVIWKTPFF